MEKLPNKEALVPEDKQKQFAEFALEGEKQRKLEEDRIQSAKKMDSASKKHHYTGMGLSVGGVGAVFTGPLGVVAGVPMVATGAYLTQKGTNEATKASMLRDEARKAKQEGNKNLGLARTVVSGGLVEGGATYEGQELKATSEQVETARKEMEEKFGDKKR